MKQIASYIDLARVIDIELCTGCAVVSDHWRGAAQPSIGRVHWHDRRVNRAGLRNFLKLVGACIHSHNRGQPEWQQLFEQNQYAYHKAMQFGVRIPAHLSHYDRARVHELLRQEHLTQKQRQIMLWAIRRG